MLLAPAWILTYPLRALLGLQSVLDPPLADAVWIVPAVGFAALVSHAERETWRPVGFAVLTALLFAVVYEGPWTWVPGVRGRPIYLLAPSLTAVGAALLGYAVADWLSSLTGSAGALDHSRGRTDDS